MKKRSKLSCENVAIGIFVLAMMFVCGLGIFQMVRSKKGAAPFASMVEQAHAACVQCSVLAQIPPSTEPYRRGKVLVVEADTGEAVGLTIADLPPEIGAANPEEVTTLVCAGEVEEVKVSTYSDGQPAYKKYRDICIYDMTTESVILVEHLGGG